MFRKAVIVPLQIPLAICLSACLIVSIAGCQSQGEDGPRVPSVDDVTDELEIVADPIQRARQLLARGDPAAAAAELRRVDAEKSVSPLRRFEWTFVDAEIQLSLGRLTAAEERATAAKPGNAGQRSRLALLFARIHAAKGDYATASAALVIAARDVDASASNGDLARSMIAAAWQHAQRVPGHRVAGRLREAGDPSEQAWWRLVDAVNGALTTQGQRTAWRRWRLDHPNHAAARFVPPTLAGTDSGPARIALFLPFTGRLKSAGETVRDGFLSAYFLSGATSRQSIHLYDTTTAPIAALYREAQRDGADAIVGPLSKEHVADMWALDPAIPTLTLNTVAVSETRRAHPIQFALTVEDEARAIANRVLADGWRRVIVLRNPENWTARAFAVLSEHLGPGPGGAGQQQPMNGEGTRLVSTGVFAEGSDVTAIVGETLLIEASKQRHAQIERLVGDEVEFTPRRRSDVDAVIALVEGSQLASLKPALAFHFASDLPIYVSSQAGRDVTNLDDLELFRICDMPWRLYPPQIKSELREAFPNNHGTADTLFAFGLDAYRLVNQMTRLTTFRDTRIMGSTGILALGTDGVIRREPVWALVKDGRFEPLAPVGVTEPGNADLATAGR